MELKDPKLFTTPKFRSCIGARINNVWGDPVFSIWSDSTLSVILVYPYVMVYHALREFFGQLVDGGTFRVGFWNGGHGRSISR